MQSLIQPRNSVATTRRRWAVILGLAVLLAFINLGLGSYLLWNCHDSLISSLANGQWPLSNGGREIVLSSKKNDDPEKFYRISLAREGKNSILEIAISGQDFSPVRLWNSDKILHLASLSKNRHFSAEGVDFSEIQTAIREAEGHVPRLDFVRRLLASLVIRPFITGARWSEKGIVWRIHTSKGTLWLGRDPLPNEADLRSGGWRLTISDQGELTPAPATTAQPVPPADFSTCLAEVIRIGTSLAVPPRLKEDTVRHSGAGWLTIQQGHIQMFLEGSPYEIGHQHGNLDPEGVEKVCRRLVYGVGLLYSLKNGEWFPAAARKLVERQRPFIAPEYFEEMKGLAEGSGLPLDFIQMANIFPEFFHCSGAALMGEATVGGELLHARVLDYMVGIGLQDHAAVMAISRPGVNRFVTVGYLGFIGSVTGMNEKQVAIGEMGGDGQGDWDGIPMSLLIRQSLEICNTLEEVEALMRNSPRTCEYYYLISDGKGPNALGVAATPTKFETFGPGIWHERLAQPVDDAVLISGPGRYESLVERVKHRYGKIGRDELVEIIKRPVAMKSNLHNVIFQPQSLRLSVADATRGGVACDQPYRTYTWNGLFSAEPSR